MSLEGSHGVKCSKRHVADSARALCSECSLRYHVYNFLQQHPVCGAVTDALHVSDSGRLYRPA